MSFSSFKSAFQNKNILIFGLGNLGGGLGVVQMFQDIGAKIRITDAKSEQELQSTLDQIDPEKVDKFILGEHRQEDVDWADVIIKNPAVPTDMQLIQYAIQQGKHVTTEAGLYLKYTEATTVGITGTRGKTTTTMMTCEILNNQFGGRVQVGGNIQNKGSLPLLKNDSKEKITILELSSWALEGCHWEKVSPKISAITNLYPDHMNRYRSMEEYADDKSAIFLYQNADDQIVLNTDNKWFEYFKNKVHSRLHTATVSDLPSNITLKIPGTHNRANASIARKLSSIAGATEQIIQETLESFSGVQYRQQIVGKNEKLTFVNDSTSTTPTSAITALNTFPTGTFIIGGTTKRLDLYDLVEKLKEFQGKVVLLKGSGTNELTTLLHESDLHYPIFGTLPEAFSAATKLSPAGTVVFSPGFTSFEMFKNEFDRAEQFDKLVASFLHL